jgi:hypothetical protein
MISLGVRPAQPSSRSGQSATSWETLSWTSRLWILYCVLLSVDFLITSDPAGALKSQSEFVVPSAMLGGLVVVVGLIVTRATQVRTIVAIPCAILLISGAFTGGLPGRPLTYLFDICTLQLCSSLAYSDAYAFPKVRWMGTLAVRLFFLAIFIGVITCLLSTNYGTLFFTLSRDARTEIDLWYFLGTYSYGAAFIIAGYFTKPSKYWIWVFIPIAALTILSYRRVWLEELFTSILVGGVILAKCSAHRSGKKIGKWVIGVAVLALPFLIQLLLLQGPNSSDQKDLTTGRSDLWAYYIKYFLQSPIYGNGAYFADNAKDYYGTAHSEIGVMRWFAEYGAFYGFFIVGLCIYALICVVNVVRKHPKLVGENPQFVFVGIMLFACFPAFIIERIFALQSPDGFLFWYGIFYVIWYSRRVSGMGSATRDAQLTT